MLAVELIKDLITVADGCVDLHNSLGVLGASGKYEEYEELLTEIDSVLDRITSMYGMTNHEQTDEGLDNLDKLGIIKEYEFFLKEFKQSLTEDLPELGEEQADTDSEEEIPRLHTEDINNLKVQAVLEFGIK